MRDTGAVREKTSDQALDLGYNVLRQCQGMVSAGGIKTTLARKLISATTSAGIHVMEAKLASDSRLRQDRIADARDELAASLYWLQLLRKNETLGPGVVQSLQRDCQRLLKRLDSLPAT